MRSYELKAHTTARIWTRECPVQDVHSYQGTVIEISIPRGGMCEYGLLGASPLGRRSGLFEVRVPPIEAGWNQSLVEGIDTVRTGLPSEYTAAVLLAGEQRATEIRFARDIRFDCACHGEVGSNSRLFGRLASAVVEVLADPSMTQDDEKMQTLLEKVRASC